MEVAALKATTLQEDGSFDLFCDKGCYDKQAILMAGYELAPTVTIAIHDNDHSWQVNLRGINQPVNITELSSHFYQSLTDHQLRVELDRQTHDIKAVIVEHAFSSVKRHIEKKK